MDIIPGILTDHEFRYFEEKDYRALEKVADDVICRFLNDYMACPEADQGVKSDLERYMGAKLRCYALSSYVLNEKLVEYVDSIAPEAMAFQNVDYQQIVDRLQILEDDYSSLIFDVMPRKKEHYNEFLKCVTDVVQRMLKSGTTTVYQNVTERIRANSFLFYTPNEKGRRTGISKLSATKRKWTIALNGAKYLIFCNNNGIDVPERRRF